MGKRDGFFMNAYEVLLEKPKDDSYRYLVIQSLSVVNGVDITLAVWDNIEDSLSYITEREFRHRFLEGEDNFAICWGDRPDINVDMRNCMVSSSSRIYMDITDFCFEFDHVALSSLIWGRFKRVCKFIQIESSDVGYRLEIEFGDMSKQEISQLIGAVWVNVCVAWINKREDKSELTLPVTRLSITDSLNGCEVLAFEKYLQSDDKFSDFMCGTDFEIGYFDVVDTLSDYVKSRKEGGRFVFQENVSESLFVVFTYSLIDLESVFCKEFAGEYVRRLETCELCDCDGTKLKDYLIGVLSDRGVWREFQKYA